MKKLVAIPGVVIAILIGILIFYNPKEPIIGSSVAPTSSGAEAVSMQYPRGSIRVASPLPGAQLSSPASISGSVTGGGWFFEGTFPVRVLDAGGDVIGAGRAQADPVSAWTSTGTVDFSGSISFSAPHSSTGTIVLLKDNPSGLSKNEESVSVPVVFSSEQ